MKDERNTRREAAIVPAIAAMTIAAFVTIAPLTACKFESAESARFGKTIAALPEPRKAAGTERFEFDSALLGKKMGLYVYLPPDYSPDKTYPVLYLLHGFGNDEIEWFDYHHLDQVANALIAEGTLKPLVIVAPRMDNSWGIDSGKPKMNGLTAKRALFNGPYEKYFLTEVMRLAESRYPVSKKPEERYLGGISMGGYAALHIGFRNPGLFSRIGGHSPALKGQQIPDYFLYAPDRKKADNDPLELAKTAKLESNAIFIDCASDDGLFAGAKECADTLKARGLNVEFSTGEGAHTAAYWHPNLGRYLSFYAGSK
ncbi:MAG TPA: alpha/beta hydrolase-fold protein [Treponemataceae bacterium]|nr:alpha/beta hydrolase-fold protein [Treponemataceae bacterium]